MPSAGRNRPSLTTVHVPPSGAAAARTMLAGANAVRTLDSEAGLRCSSAACASAARTCACAVGHAALRLHSATHRRVACGASAARSAESTCRDAKYHVRRDSTATSKGGASGARAARKASGSAWTQVMRGPRGPAERCACAWEESRGQHGRRQFLSGLTVIERARVDAGHVAGLAHELCEHGGGVALAAADLEDAGAGRDGPVGEDGGAVGGGLELDLEVLGLVEAEACDGVGGEGRGEGRGVGGDGRHCANGQG